MAEGSGGGLIEATTHMVAGQRVGSCIYKRLRLPAYVYTGICMVPAGGSSFVWTVVAAGRGTTGVTIHVINSSFRSIRYQKFGESCHCYPQISEDVGRPGVNLQSKRDERLEQESDRS